MKLVEVKNLNFHYDENTYAVKDVSFSIERGSYTSIVGHNGSGKSTIAKLLLGLLQKDSGEININGLELNEANLAEIRNKVGIVFQNPDNQFIGSTVRDDIAFGLENHNIPQENMDDIIEKFAAKVNMTNYLDHEPTRLSGGQKQRVAIAGVLAMSPEIIIFDESTSMLDPQGKAEINEVIRELHAEGNLTILSITHDIEEVSKSDYVLVMNEGKLVKEGKPQDILLNSDELVNLKLDAPFAVKMVNELHKNGITISNSCSIERVVDELCQLNSKK